MIQLGKCLKLQLYIFTTDNPCRQNDCQNPIKNENTTCRADGPGAFTCICPPGFSGEKCEYRKHKHVNTKQQHFQPISFLFVLCHS